MDTNDPMDEIFNLCQQALIWEGMCENAKFNFKLFTEIEKITEESVKSHRDYLKNGTSLRADGYILTDIMEGMSRKELIEEILSTHSHEWLVENAFIKKTEHGIPYRI